MNYHSSSYRDKYYDNQYMADIYKLLGDYESSTFHFERSLAYKDSIEQNKAQFMLKEHQMQLEEAEEKERELRALNQEQQA